MISLPDRFNFVDTVLRAADPDRTAFMDPDQNWTYRELELRVQSVSAWLYRQGVRAEQRVAIIMRDGCDMAAIILGCMRAGMVAVPLDPRSSLDNLRHCLEHSGSVLALVETQEVKEQLSRPGMMIHTSGVFDSLYRTGPLPPAADTHRDSAAIFMYTSGTTGHPKAVVHAQGSLMIIGRSFGQETIGWKQDDVSFSTAKLFFSFGLFNLWNTLVAGAATYFNPGISMPNVLADIVRERRPTIMISVPALWGKMLRYDLSDNQLRMCLSGGDRMPETLFRAWQKRTGLRLHNICGTTEAGTAYTFNEDGPPASIGRPINGYDIEIRDNQMWVRAPSAGICYWHDLEWSRRMFGEWMPTGDIVRRDRKGYYHYLGRASDVVKVNGRYVDMMAIEHAFMEYPGVQEAVVVGQQDEVGHTRLRAYVVADPGHKLDTRDLAQYVREHSTEFPREIELVDALPRTENGKVQRYKLRQLM